MAEASLQALIEALRRLPGVGVKSASRMAFHLLQHDREGALRLAAALQAAGHAVDLSVEVGAVSDSPARRNAAAAARRQQAAEQIILNDPFVQQMQRDFGANIVPGSIKPIAKH